MKLIKKYGLFIFWGVLILDCFLCIINHQSDRIYTKTLLMPVLAFYFFANTKRSRHSRSKTTVYSSLLVAWIADILLLKNDLLGRSTIDHPGDTLLFAGIVLLLVCFLLYGYMFNKMNGIIIKDCQEAFLSAVAMLVVSGLFFKFLNMMPLGIFKYLIIAGMGIATLVMALAANVYKDKVRKNIAYKFFVPGCIILFLSTGILISYRFLLQDAEFLPAVIVLTYGFGQMLIMRGFTKYLKA